MRSEALLPQVAASGGRDMKRGFTLIELLVVMAIISILASILFPVFSRAIDKAKATACLSNVKQIQMATMMYSQDYDQCYPPGPYLFKNPDGTMKTLNWYDTLQPYIENYQIMVDPAVPDQKVGYGISYWIIGTGGAQAHKSSEKITYACASVISGAVSWYIYPYTTNNGIAAGSPNADTPDPNPDGDPATLGSQPPMRHNDGANFAYADGHAKWSRVESVGVHDFETGWDPPA
jgi:prepilin-type N-terminal cleavage/methylation domain-containing protein/prepilin-type processing-associated H-X9-DG protein